MADPVPISVTDATLSMAPAYEWSLTVDTKRETKAVYLALTAGAVNMAITPHYPSGASSVNVPVGGQFYPLRTRVAVTATGYTVVYLY